MKSIIKKSFFALCALVMFPFTPAGAASDRDQVV